MQKKSTEMQILKEWKCASQFSGEYFPIFIIEHTPLASILYKTSSFSAYVLFFFHFYVSRAWTSSIETKVNRPWDSIIIGSSSYKGSNFGSNLRLVCAPIAPLNPTKWCELRGHNCFMVIFSPAIVIIIFSLHTGN